MNKILKKILLYASIPVGFWLTYNALISLAKDMAEIDWEDDLYKTEDDDGWC